MRIEQDRGDLATGHTVRHAVEGAKLERHLSALDARELEATHEWTCTLPGEAALQAFDCVLAHGGVVIARDYEAAASRRAATDEPELMISVRITDQDVMTIVRAHARQDRRQIVEIDCLRG
jgi:xylose isomerase